MEEEILKKITSRVPDFHFKACPWCLKEPELKVEIYGCDPKEYRLTLKTCDCLNSDKCLNTYNIKTIPKDPFVCPNPKRRKDVSWNGGVHPDGDVVEDVPFEEFPLRYIEFAELSEEEQKQRTDKYGLYEGKSGRHYDNISWWAYSVQHRFEYLSDSYPYQCCSCHKKWRGYESLGDEVIVDGKSYCKACAGIWMNPDAERPFPRYDIICDSLNVDSMYIQDSPPKYYTSLVSCLDCHDLSAKDVYARYVKDDRKGHGWDALSGDICGGHWDIIKYNTDPKLSENSHWNWVGFVYEPSETDLEILTKLKKDRKAVKK